MIDCFAHGAYACALLAARQPRPHRFLAQPWLLLPHSRWHLMENEMPLWWRMIYRWWRLKYRFDGEWHTADGEWYTALMENDILLMVSVPFAQQMVNGKNRVMSRCFWRSFCTFAFSHSRGVAVRGDNVMVDWWQQRVKNQAISTCCSVHYNQCCLLKTCCCCWFKQLLFRHSVHQSTIFLFYV